MTAMTAMKVVVVGSGGREHALARVLSRTADVVVAPGNPGMVRGPGAERITGSTEEPEKLDADLFVIGPELPLVDGLADRLRNQGKRVFGPGADGARLEGSKSFMKDLLVEAGVPTARHGTFSEVEPALEYLRSLPGPWVVKTDGLAAGKGVLVTAWLGEAEDDVRDKLSSGAFGDAGRTVVIEEGLSGPEVSLLAVCDGTRAVALAPAQDFKRAGDGDTGPNTGGMGAYSPVPVATPEVVEQVMAEAVEPTLACLRAKGIDYRGVLYAGLMLTPDGPKVLEYNVRFGDPEAQVVLPRLRSDLAELLAAAADGDLTEVPAPLFGDRCAVTVVCACDGYPAAPSTGDVIEGLDDVWPLPDVQVYAAGVGVDDKDRIITTGGRVLDVTGFGETVEAARERAYDAVSRVSWPGMHHRSDIAAL
jgi:phosphoribosylamine--glycine ligase